MAISKEAIERERERERKRGREKSSSEERIINPLVIKSSEIRFNVT